MALTTERAAYVALALTPGIGAQRMATLLASCDTAHGALAAPFSFLRTLPGIGRACATALKATTPEMGVQAIAAAEAMGAHLLCPDDPGFPPALRTIPEPPMLLFAQGDMALLERPAVAIVGSRDHSAYGAEVARAVAGAAAAAGLAVVSGMARGLDAVAHYAALEAGGGTIGVLGNGLGVIYPTANRRLYERVNLKGLLLTEFAPGERPMIGGFPRRNRLISGLARVTVVIEAAEGSGTLITVGTALEQGRDVMVVPGNITSRTSIGTNRLIREGAEPLLEVGDLLRHFPEVTEQAAVALPAAPGAAAIPDHLAPAEREVFGHLAGGPLGLDDLVLRAGLPAPELLAILTVLELRGHVVQRQGRLEVAGA